MATIKRDKQKKETEKAITEKIATPAVVASEPEQDTSEPPIIEEKKPVKPVIRVLEARAMPQLSQPQNKPAYGNLLVCDRKTGKCTSFAEGYAHKLVKQNKNLYVKN